MLMDYEFQGERHRFFVESNAEPEIMDRMLADYRKSVKRMTPGGMIRFIRGYGYQANQLLKSDTIEKCFFFDGKMSVREFLKRRIRECVAERFFLEKGFSLPDFEAGTVDKDGAAFDFFLYQANSDDQFDCVVDDRLMLQNILNAVEKMKKGQSNNRIVADLIIEYSEQFTPDEISYVDHQDSDEVVQFGQVLHLIIYTSDEGCFCPACFTESGEGNFTVMNHVDQNLQSVLLQRRLGVKPHGHVMECPNCKEWFETDSKKTILEAEKAEIKFLWQGLPESAKY